MKNIWKYASLGERDRLDMIRNGNSDVYNTEKERNKQLRQLRADLGLATDDIDNWDGIIDSANSSYLSKGAEKKANLPKISSGRLAQINRAMSNELSALRRQRDESIETANEEAADALSYLEEWLASNGYSEEGNLSVKSKKELSDALSDVIDEIKSNYSKQVNGVRSRYRAMV